jgi:hypothetical protein
MEVNNRIFGGDLTSNLSQNQVTSQKQTILGWLGWLHLGRDLQQNDIELSMPFSRSTTKGPTEWILAK